jgi:acyl-CoA thioester hydrolase
MQLIRPFRHTLRATYADCTVGNHVYYARYFNFLEAARSQFFRSLGHPFQSLENDGFAFPVIHCAGDFKRSARFDDLLHIDLWLTSLARIRLDLAYRVANESDQILFEGRTRHACTDLRHRGARIPQQLADRLKDFLAS